MNNINNLFTFVKSNTYQIIGGLCGFVLWIYMLESNKMKGVLYRKDENNNTIFTPHNILRFMIAPFRHTYFWTTELILHNWIVMTLSGTIIGWLVYNLIVCYIL